jgi:hypothetical protein
LWRLSIFVAVVYSIDFVHYLPFLWIPLLPIGRLSNSNFVILFYPWRWLCVLLCPDEWRDQLELKPLQRFLPPMLRCLKKNFIEVLNNLPNDALSWTILVILLNNKLSLVYSCYNFNLTQVRDLKQYNIVSSLTSE